MTVSIQFNEYKECKSVQNEIKKLIVILEKYKIEVKTKELIINDYLLELIPAGTKGVMRGNKFNSIGHYILNDGRSYKVCYLDGKNMDIVFIHIGW
jgi:hypothetical protein